jgi:hypothetical protein
MKKNMFVLFVLAVVCSIVTAEPIGISVGIWPGYSYTKDNAEFAENSEDSYFTLMPEIGYSSFFGNLSVSALVDYTFSFDDPVKQDLYATEEVGYMFPLNEVHSLAFKVYNENNLSFKPEYSDAVPPNYNYIRPSVTYGLTTSPGTASFGAGLPVTYLPDTGYGLWLTAGYAFSFGLTVDLVGHISFNTKIENEETGYKKTELNIGYGYGPWFFLLLTEADKKFENITVIPQATYSLGSIDLSLSVMFMKMYGEAEGFVFMDAFLIAPSIGVAYRF